MKLRESELLFIYLLFDLTILNIAIFLTARLGPDINIHIYDKLNIYFLHANLSWVITYFVFSKKNLYLRDGFQNRFWRILKRTVIYVIVAAILGFTFLPNKLSRLFLFEYIILFFVLKLIFYRILYLYLKNVREKGSRINRTIIVGLNDTSKLLRRIIDNNVMLGYKFVGFVSKHPDRDVDVIGNPDDLEQIITENNVQHVFVTLSLFNQSDRGREFLKVCNRLGVKLRFIPENQSWFRSKVNMESVGSIVVINPQENPLDDIESRIMKRTADIVVSFFVIILIFTWMIPILAIIIKLTSKGPVFFVQKRTGFDNKPFNCLKFRSMKVNCDADKKQATANDNRITAIGRFMRKTNLDEFPQFLNVLLGQMSIVGPRPHMLKHTEEYSKLIDKYLTRHYVKPGITGWAQVNGYRGETDELWKMEKRVEYDFDYIENWHLWWDVRIIFQTIFGKKAFQNAG